MWRRKTARKGRNRTLTDKAEHPPLPQAFAALGLRSSILRGLAEAKFETPSEIQTLLIPKALAGIDIFGQARTGTGKTAAFGMPILQNSARGVAIQAIIFVPTRELAVQVDAELKRLAQFTPIRSCPVYGGQKITAQMKFLKHGPEMLVGTPGRVIDLLDRRIINFNNVRFAVLDEVDRMLDIGFRDDIRNILSRIKGVRSDDAGQESTNDRAQAKRERVMNSFRHGKFDVLIATDLASRGIDVADISHIIQVDCPEDPEVYVHRIGRTARMGARGKAFTFITKEQGDELTKIEN